MKLIRYNAACKALVEAKRVDEVKQIRDASMAMKVYAHQAKNRVLEMDALEIRLRAERKLGEMLKVSERAKGTDKGGSKKIDGSRKLPSNPPPTLKEIGIDKQLSAKSQKLAEIPGEVFEQRIADWRDKLSDNGGKVESPLKPPKKEKSSFQKFVEANAKKEPYNYDLSIAVDAAERLNATPLDKVVIFLKRCPSGAPLWKSGRIHAMLNFWPEFIEKLTQVMK